MRHEHYAERPTATLVARSSVFESVARLCGNSTAELQQGKVHVDPAPFYWQNKLLQLVYRSHESSFMLQKASSFFQSLCQSRACRTQCPLRGWHVSRVWRIENPWLWQAYSHKKAEIAAKVVRYNIAVEPMDELVSWLPADLQKSLDSSLNETYLLHGCSPSNAQIIEQAGFDERVSSLKALYGCGVYTTSQACKALQYARADGCSVYWKERCGKFWCECNGPRTMFLTRVLPSGQHRSECTAGRGPPARL